MHLTASLHYNATEASKPYAYQLATVQIYLQ